MSKSGLFAHFGSKEELQLATVEAAGAVIGEEIVAPALEQPEGVRRLQALCESFLSYVERRVFPGGCFFTAAAAELDAKSGRVKEAVAEAYREWFALLEESARKAQELGELDPSADPAQLVFELIGMLEAANTFHQLFDDPALLERARSGVLERLEALSRAA
jgi:AcrR family transcriptional regulator